MTAPEATSPTWICGRCSQSFKVEADYCIHWGTCTRSMTAPPLNPFKLAEFVRGLTAEACEDVSLPEGTRFVIEISADGVYVKLLDGARGITPAATVTSGSLAARDAWGLGHDLRTELLSQVTR